jgi:Tol biopolymer transport system component
MGSQHVLAARGRNSEGTMHRHAPRSIGLVFAVVFLVGPVSAQAAEISVTAKASVSVTPTAAVPALVTQLDGPGLYVVGADGQGLRRLAGPGLRPSWSPDGTRVAYVSPGFEVVVTDLATGASRVVGSGVSTWDAVPSWSPDSRYLAYPGQGTGWDRDAWIADASGATAPRRLVRLGDDAEVAWGPDGRLARAGAGVVISDADGSNALQIYPGGHYGPLKWSPDGRALVYLPDSTAVDLLIDADGSNPRMLGDSGRLGLSIYQADWAPSSVELVYYENAYRTGHEVIGVAPADGGPGREIATDAREPIWSPKGQAIAVIKDTRDDATPIGGIKAAVTWGDQLLSDLVLMAHDGTGSRVVVRSTLNLTAPAWSPDGTTLAFVAR